MTFFFLKWHHIHNDLDFLNFVVCVCLFSVMDKLITLFQSIDFVWFLNYVGFFRPTVKIRLFTPFLLLSGFFEFCRFWKFFSFQFKFFHQLFWLYLILISISYIWFPWISHTFSSEWQDNEKYFTYFTFNKHKIY